MAIYDTGTASLSASGQVTGVGTQWTRPLTLIRVGATIVFKTEPVKIYTISEITSDTSMSVYNPNSETVPAGTGYAILAHDGISVQGLAQDVAETLRYYQSRESEVATAVDTFNNFDQQQFTERVEQVDNQYTEIQQAASKISSDAAQVSIDKEAASSSAASALNSKNAAQASAQEAADYAASLDTQNLLRKDLALSDLTDKALARGNIDVYSKSEVDDKTSRFEQNPDSTIIDSGTNLYKFFVGEADWGYLRTSDSERIPLPVISGGTGGVNAMQASSNIEAAFIKYPVTTNYGDIGMKTGFGIFDDSRSPYPGGPDGFPYVYSEIFTIAEDGGGTGNFSQIGFSTITEQAPRYRQRFNNPSRFTNWRDFFVRDLNTTVDPGGFIKIASPIVKVFHDGSFESSESAQGVIVSRESEGVYFVTGCKGLNSDASWGGVDGGFEIPLDKNKQPKIWIDYDVLSDGSLRVRTYHREHKDSPSFARNLIDGYSDCQPIDIPKDSFVSVRVNM